MFSIFASQGLRALASEDGCLGKSCQLTLLQYYKHLFLNNNDSLTDFK